MGRVEHEVNPRGPDISVDEQLARQLSAGLDHPNRPGHSLSAGVFPNQTQNSFDTGDWRCSSCTFGIFFLSYPSHQKNKKRGKEKQFYECSK